MTKRTDSLLFKFAVIFLIFAFATLFMASLSIYLNQTESYKQQAENSIKDIAQHLKTLILMDKENFLNYQKYLLENHDKIYIHHDFKDDYIADKKDFEKFFTRRYPGKIFDVDVKFDDMSDDVKIAFVKYYHEYWLKTFEDARGDFGIKYTYYITPGKEKLHMIYILDGVREVKIANDVEYLELCDDAFEPFEEHQKMWEAWNTGKEPEGYDTYDNEYGKTYAYYTPLVIDDEVVGVIGTEVEIEKVNAEILRLTLKQLAGMSLIIFLGVFCLLGHINRKYISKLSHLQSNVREYSQNKNPKVVKDIEKEAEGQDEIAALSMQVAAMILELENYMKHLIKIAKELSNTKERALQMHELAHKDALTGVNNKNSYDKAMHELDWKIADDSAEFAIAMIDLNFLKRINDTYGHEQGNFAIQKLCEIVQEIFTNSPVYRIGGDEFVVILEDEDYFAVEELTKKFNKKLEEFAADETLEVWEKISASIGVAIFDKNIDSSASNVFKRADKAMYIRKKEMKAVRT